MQITTQSNYINTQQTQQSASTKEGLSTNSFLSQLDEDIQKAFEEVSIGLDDETKFKRAMSLSFHMSHPMFMMFEDGKYPDKMPADVKSAMEQQQSDYLKLNSKKEQNTYKITWMIEHIGHEISSDPGFEGFLVDMRNSYLGEIYSQKDDDVNYALEQFKNDLSTKGALKFLYDFNQEKIDEMVEKFKEKLLKQQEENPDIDLDIEKLVSEYRKELMQRLAELEDENEKSPVNIKQVEFEVIKNLTPKLEDLLQEGVLNSGATQESIARKEKMKN